MKKVQIDQYDMLLAVEDHFDVNASDWTSNIPISDAKTALSGQIDALTTEIGLQLQKSTGVTEDKAALRNDLEEKGFILSAALSSYAATNPGMKEMYRNVHFPKSDFPKFREAELIDNISHLNDEAVKVIENLAPYGVTEATLTELLVANDAFRKIKNKPKEVISNRKDATDDIGVMLRQAVSLLDDQMDSLVEMLRATYPQFVSVYFNERHTHSTGHHAFSLTITTLDANTNAPLAKADIEIIGKGIKRVSSDRGYNRVQNLQQGNYQLSISRPGFASQVIPFIIISGETTQLVIEMQSVLTRVLE